LTSKDLDLHGTRGMLEELKRRFDGVLIFGAERGPVVGQLKVLLGGKPRKIEVLRDVRGMSDRDLREGWQMVQFEDYQVRVPMPTVLLMAKLANAAQIPQVDRNDVKHVKIMILVVREFLSEILVSLENGEIQGRVAVDVLEETLSVISSADARKCQRVYQVDLAEAWPLDKLGSCGNPRVEKFVTHRLSRWMEARG